MDNPDLRETRSWAPDPPLVGVAWVAAVAALAAVFLIGDAPGRVLLVVLAGGLGLAGLFGTVARPRLVADHHGVTVRGLTGRRHWPWSEVNVRLVRTRRFGREVSTVEVDAEEDLVVLGRLDLGADPEDVVEAIRALRT
ncbi:MAG TPA: PH domain-containing protein [Actinophytocola sp.]|uniref:PH domain-containing protein n=1 Tax=Actinophytocola sp. TaxID=1872138 RepID=UPI002DBA0A10|nr:PH domain-containing protein [Actinophytocola sp.]HEU5473145.1 PH domain-containing protein [Actinophytocola sp.]